MAKKDSHGKRKGGVPNKQALYQSAAAHALDAIKVLVERMNDKNEQGSVRTGAAKALLNKCLPDLKSTEWKSEDGDQLRGLIIVKTDANKAK